jgi:hypothetical protein
MTNKPSHYAHISRRNVLKAAVMGVSALSLNAVNRATAQSPDAEPDVDILSGTLTAFNTNWVEIQTGDSLKRVPVDMNTSFWKGGASMFGALRQGDDILLRVATKSGVAMRIWSNLTRYRGQIRAIRTAGSAWPQLVVKSADHRQPAGEIAVILHELTHLGDPNVDLTPSPKDLPGSDRDYLRLEDYVDIIGEQLQDGIRATTVILWRPRPEKSTMESGKRPADVVTHIGPMSVASYSGHANWYNCPTGAGGCGMCNTGNPYQLAWPTMGANCQYSVGCAWQISRSCGSSVTVRDWCAGKQRTCTVVDCGPNQLIYCYQGCGYPNCSDMWPPVVDLTKPTFAYFRDPDAGWGCFACIADAYY